MDKLRTIAIVVPEGDLVLSSIVGSYKLFRDAIKETSAQTDVIILGAGSKKKGFFDGLFQLTAIGSLKDQGDVDLIVVPAIKSDPLIAIEENTTLINWLKTSYLNGAKVASLCSGAFLVAASGILAGRPCTCHWANASDFKHRFPHVDFRSHEIVTEAEGIFTSGGAFSFFNLILYLIERFFGVEPARRLAAVYQIDYLRTSQAPFVLFEMQKDHGEPLILKAQEFLEAHFAEPLLISDVAQHVQLSPRTLARRFKSCTGHTVNQYLQRVRIEMAKCLLVETRKTINEVQFASGYSDPKTFRRIFRKQTRSTPMAYRRQFSRQASG